MSSPRRPFSASRTTTPPASLVCKLWRSVVSNPAFLRRLHDLHRTPPVLGFLHDVDDERFPSFVPTTASAFSLPAPDRRSWRALDCRHGRVLFVSRFKGMQGELLVWEPIKGDQWHVPVPAALGWYTGKNAAVLCAADGCDHRGCHGGPFGVIFVFNDCRCTMKACVYSSETGAWGKPTWLRENFMTWMKPSALVGQSLLYFMCERRGNSISILEYNLTGQSTAMIDLPEALAKSIATEKIILLSAPEDSALGVARIKKSSLCLWSREASNDSDARWVQSRVIQLHNLLPDAPLLALPWVGVIGFASEANVIFLTTADGVIAIELQSPRARKLWERSTFGTLIPIASLYIPDAHAFPPSSLLVIFDLASPARVVGLMFSLVPTKFAYNQIERWQSYICVMMCFLLM